MTRTVPTQCTLCEAHCGVLVTLDEDRVVKVEGDPEDVLSQGYICPKGTALADLHHDPERLRRPVNRVGDAWEEVSWDEAFDIVGRNIRRIRAEHGRDAIGMYFGNPAVHSPGILNALLLRFVLLTRHAWSASSADQFPQEHVAHRMYGSNLLFPIADMDRTDHLMILGANPAVSNGSVTTMPDARGRIRAVRDRGGTVVVVDPRRTETARIADEHVPVRPGGDVHLLLAMLHTLVEDGLRPPNHPAMEGLDELCALARSWSPEEAAPHAGVDAATIRRLARDFASADAAVLFARIGVCHQVTGTLVHWLVNAINAVTGNLDAPGGQMFATPAVDLMPLLARLPTGPNRWHDRSGRYRAMRAELPSATLADSILEPGDGRVRAMITHAGNPVLSASGEDRVDEAFASLDFHVAIDMYVTETSRHADVILPPVSHLERAEFDLVFQLLGVRNTARFNHRVVEPPADGLDDWEILARLVVEVLPLPLRGLTSRVAETVVAQLDPMHVARVGVAAGPHGVLRRGPKGLTLGKVRRARGGIDLGVLEPRLEDLMGRGRRVDLAPDDLVTTLEGFLSAVRRGEDPDAAPRGYDLRLIGRRHLRSNNSWLHNVETMVKGRDRCTVLIHPDDAAERGILDREPVAVTSPHGEIEVPAEISDEIRPGTVAVPHGWGHDRKGVGWSTAAAHGGVNVNRLHDPHQVDTISGNAAMNATWVRCEPARTTVDA